MCRLIGSIPKVKYSPYPRLRIMQSPLKPHPITSAELPGLVIEIGEIMYSTLTNHSKTAQSYTQRYPNSFAYQISQDIYHIYSLNGPQLKQMTQSTIKMHIPNQGMHIANSFHSPDDTLPHQLIPNGITPCTHLFLFP